MKRMLLFWQLQWGSMVKNVFEEKQDAGKVIQVEPGDVIKDAVRVIDQAENL